MIIGVDPMALADFAAALAQRLPDGLGLIKVGDFEALAKSEEPGLLLGASFWNEARRVAFGEILPSRTRNHPHTTWDHAELMAELMTQGFLARPQWPVRFAPDDLPMPVSIAFHLPVQTQVTPPLETRADVDDALMQMVLSGIEANRLSLLGPEPPSEAQWSFLVASHDGLAWSDPTGPPDPPSTLEAFARHIADLARLDVARVDVGVVAGEPKVWRIDDRPAALLPPEGALNEPFAHWLSGLALGI